ncbi:MAG: AraC family transcriptional regulator [Bacteroidota bacterium]
MIKKIAFGFMGILVITALWYFFIKAEDYRINFKVDTSIGTVNQSIKSWNTSLKDSQPIVQNSFNELSQTIRSGDSVHYYHWDFQRQNDSVVQVTLKVTDSAYSLKNRWAVLFGGNTFTDNTKKRGKEFLDLLDSHLKKIRVKIKGEAETPERFSAYVPIKSSQITKAKGMMEYINTLTNFIVQNDLEPKGTPFVEITRWDRKKDSLEYKFCFPIVKTDSLPEHHLVKYHETTAKKALMAIYNGNYITSDRAWYALEEYAEKNNIQVTSEIYEVFHNNPNMGGNELTWKTEVFMVLKEQ